MKKVSLLLVIGICFAMLGCGAVERENTAQTTQQPAGSTAMADAPTEVTNPTTAPAETTEPTEVSGGNVSHGDVVFLHIETLEEYKKHFEENGGYPENFVTYEDLCKLGDFKNFRCQSYNMLRDENDYTTYGYDFMVGEVVIHITVRIAERISEDIKKLEWEDVRDAMVASDLRTNPADVFKREDIFRGKVVCGEYTYNYIEGKLLSIEWIVGETRILIYIPSLSNPWPENDPETLIGRMLIWDTAEEALGELREKIDGKLKDLKYPD